MLTTTPDVSSGFSFSNFSMQMKETELLIAAKAGDQEAFVELCRRATPVTSRAIYRVVKNPADTEDALQDCFLKAYRALHSFDQRATFSTWLTRIGINSALMILRKRGKYREEPMFIRSEEGITWNEVDVADDATPPDELCIQTERVFRIREAIGRLPESLRSVIELQHAVGASIQQISDTLNISVPAAKSRLLRGRSALRRMLQPQSAIL